jgi:hypothetical protein
MNIIISAGWNIISVPVAAQNMNTEFLFPDFTSPTYGFNGAYLTKTTLETGKGYWIRYANNDTVRICGEKNHLSTIPLVSGWNLIGIYEKEITTGSITTTPSSIINSLFYGYNAGYFVPATLSTGRGYWVRTSQSGVMNVPEGIPKNINTDNLSPNINSEWSKIVVTDSRERSNILYLSNSDRELFQFDLPPIPPEGVFDVRFASGRMVENLAGIQQIELNSVAYPIKLRVQGIDLRVKDVLGGGFVNRILEDGEELVVANPEISKLQIEATGEAMEFRLIQNYPNPFNPSTVISYQLPVDSKVDLRLYDVLGREVSILVANEQKSGRYEVKFDGSGFPSGIYLYRIEIIGKGNTLLFMDSKKMMFIK